MLSHPRTRATHRSRTTQERHPPGATSTTVEVDGYGGAGLETDEDLWLAVSVPALVVATAGVWLALR
jgi:hypothetical protein